MRRLFDFLEQDFLAIRQGHCVLFAESHFVLVEFDQCPELCRTEYALAPLPCRAAADSGQSPHSPADFTFERELPLHLPVEPAL